MLSLSKKTDYALIALGDLAEDTQRVASARQIAVRCGLPVSLLMNILKSLHGAGFIQSIRGTKGGYRLAIRLHEVSLHELIVVVDGGFRLTECSGQRAICEQPSCRLAGRCPIEAPLQALHYRLEQFLEDVKLSDLIVPGQRIDVPLEMIGGVR